MGKIDYFLGFSRVVTVASKYLLAEITIGSQKIIQRTKEPFKIFCLHTISFNILGTYYTLI